VNSDVFDDFATEPGGMGSGSVRVSDILATGVQIRWDEAVALLQEILEIATTAGGGNVPIPALEDVIIDRNGAVTLTAGRRGDRGPVAAGRTLHTLLATADVPLPLRLFVTQANAPETHNSLQSFAEGLAYFGRPGRDELIRAIYERYRASAPAVTSSSQRPATPAPLPHRDDARSDRHPNQLTTSQWLMPAAVAICVVSLAAVIWFGLLNAGGSASASAVVPTNAVSAEAPATAKDATPTPTSAKPRTAKATVAERQPAQSATTRAQSAPPDRKAIADVAPKASALLFDPSTIRAPEARSNVPEAPARETTTSTVPSVPVSSEYVVAPLEGATTTIYSPADTDVQPPVMIYPSLPPPIFVARNADAVVVNRMELVISADGTVERVRLVNGPWRMPDMMLLSGAKLWKFSPAVKNGTPVRYRTTVTWTGFP